MHCGCFQWAVLQQFQYHYGTYRCLWGQSRRKWGTLEHTFWLSDGVRSVILVDQPCNLLDLRKEDSYCTAICYLKGRRACANVCAILRILKVFARDFNEPVVRIVDCAVLQLLAISRTEKSRVEGSPLRSTEDTYQVVGLPGHKSCCRLCRVYHYISLLARFASAIDKFVACRA